MNMPKHLEKLGNGTITTEEVEELRRYFQQLQANIASGDRAFAIVGGAAGVTIHTGDKSKRSLARLLSSFCKYPTPQPSLLTIKNCQE